MKVTKAKSAEHRAALIAAGSKLFQERGFDGAGITEISATAGLTQGALYNQFPSKSALAAAACRKSHDDGMEQWLARRGTTENDVAAYSVRSVLGGARGEACNACRC